MNGTPPRGGRLRHVFSADVPVRWSDLDAFGHVNHARTVTLLEEGRIGLLFTEAERASLDGLAKGAVVVRLSISYKRPIFFTAEPVRVDTTVRQLRAASFVLDQAIVAGGVRAVEAEVLVAPYDVETSRPRLLTPAEREFLQAWCPTGSRKQ